MNPTIQGAKACMLCGGASKTFLFAHDTIETTPRRFSILRCPQCGLHVLSPRPSFQEIIDFSFANWESTPGVSDPTLNAWQRWLWRRHWRLRCRAVQRFHGGGRLLDVGCGAGGFLQALCANGHWQATGVEVNERHVAYAQQVLGLTVHRGVLSSQNFPAHSFDVVTMWDVVEHLLDPLETLQAIARLLKANGTLLLSTPNAHSWQARLWGEHWTGWSIPLHVHLFTPVTLQRILARAGFRVVKRFHFPAERFYLVASWRRKLERAHGRFAKGPSGNALRRRIIGLTPAVGVILWPLLRLLDFSDHASQLVVAAVPA